MSGDLSNVNNSHIFSPFLWFFIWHRCLKIKQKVAQSSKIADVKIQRLFEIILEKQQASKREKWSVKSEWKEVAISNYKNAFVTGKHILKVYNTYKQNKEKFNTRTLNLTKTVPFASTPKVSKNIKTSKQSVEEVLKKARAKMSARVNSRLLKNLISLIH